MTQLGRARDRTPVIGRAHGCPVFGTNQPAGFPSTAPRGRGQGKRCASHSTKFQVTARRGDPPA
jgi:hypothetical protein